MLTRGRKTGAGIYRKICTPTILLFFVGFLLPSAFGACGNPRLVRTLKPAGPGKVRVIKKDKSFAWLSGDLEVEMELLGLGEIVKMALEENEDMGYERGYRVPNLTYFKITIHNRAPYRLYVDLEKAYFQDDTPVLQKYPLYDRVSYQERFASQVYAYFDYGKILKQRQLRPAPMNTRRREAKNDKKSNGQKEAESTTPVQGSTDTEKKKERFLLNIVGPGDSLERICAWPKFSEQALRYRLVVPYYKLTPGKDPARRQEMVRHFDFIIEREE